MRIKILIENKIENEKAPKENIIIYYQEIKQNIPIQYINEKIDKI